MDKDHKKTKKKPAKGKTVDEEEKWAAHRNQLNIYRDASFWHLDDEERQPRIIRWLKPEAGADWTLTGR